MKKTAEDREADRAKAICAIAREYAPCIHLFIWNLAKQRYPDIHPAEVYRAIRSDDSLMFDGKTSIVNISKDNNNKELPNGRA